jgi:hypothetical protein
VLRLFLLLSGIIALNVKLIATVLSAFRLCSFIADKVQLPAAFDRRQDTGLCITAVMDSRQPGT